MPQILAIAGGTAMALCQWLIFFYAPTEVTMGLVQKIFYTHLPLAGWALCSFFTVFIGSILYIWKRSPAADQLCQAAAEIGVLFSALALVCGIIWAKKSWGVWWTWDPRLTTTLIMLFIYSAYLLIGSMDFTQEKSRLVRSVIGIVAFLDVPLVFFSARIFRSIHPAVFASGSGGLEPEMLQVVLACFISLGIFWLSILLLRQKQIRMKEKLDELLFEQSERL